jgi:hypothetical protein
LDLNGSQANIRIFELETRKLAGMIYNEVQKKHPECLKEEIWLDIPSPPGFDESELTFVSPYTEDSEPMSFNNFFPSKMWAEQYRTHKFRTNVFCPQEFVEETSRVTYHILEDKYKLTLNKLAFEICHRKAPAE